jgi:hypothetical protein
MEEAKKIWIDLDNSPHVPFFKPIIGELAKRGYSIFLTVRDCFQVGDLADMFHMKFKKIGRHYGKNVYAKAFGMVARSVQLLPATLIEKPDLAVSHGSRSQLLLADLLGIPTIELTDYEHTKTFTKTTWAIIPEVIPESSMPPVKRKILKYPGIKEDVYIPDFVPDPAIREELGLLRDEIAVTIRPPATEAHYHNPESEAFLDAIIERISNMEKTRMIILPRNKGQELEIRNAWPHLFEAGKIVIPARVVDGLNLIWHSDLVISGGGTMNREAAALGVPVYSIFRGKIGAVDRYLERTGRLVLLDRIDHLYDTLRIEKRDIPDRNPGTTSLALAAIVDGIVQALENGNGSQQK